MTTIKKTTLAHHVQCAFKTGTYIKNDDWIGRFSYDNISKDTFFIRQFSLKRKKEYIVHHDDFWSQWIRTCVEKAQKYNFNSQKMNGFF